MRSFALSALATLAFGVFCSAAPTSNGMPVVDVAARGVENPTLQSVLGTATDGCSPLLDKITGLHVVGAVDEVVEEVIVPVLGEVIVILETALAGVQALLELPVEKVLCDVTTGVLLDVDAIVNLVVCLLRVVLTLLQCVLSIVGGLLNGEVLPLVQQIVHLLCQILSCVLTLVGSLVGAVIAGVVAALGDLVKFIIYLNIAELLDILCIAH